MMFGFYVNFQGCKLFKEIAVGFKPTEILGSLQLGENWNKEIDHL